MPLRRPLSAEAENELPHQPKPLLTGLRPLTLAGTEPPPIVEEKPSRLRLSSPVGNVEPTARNVAVTSPTDAESARVRQPRSLPVEPVSPSSTNIEPSPPIFGKEPSRSVLLGRQINVEPTEKTNQPDNLEPTASAAPTDAESTGARQETPSLAQSRLISITRETSRIIRERGTSRPTLCGQPDNVEPAVGIVAVIPPANAESARPQQAMSLQAELSAPISIGTKTSPADFQTEPSPPTLAGQSDNMWPTASNVADVPAKPPLPIFEKEPSRPEPASKAVSFALPTDAECVVMQQREAKAAVE